MRELVLMRSVRRQQLFGRGRVLPVYSFQLLRLRPCELLLLLVLVLVLVLVLEQVHGSGGMRRVESKSVVELRDEVGVRSVHAHGGGSQRLCGEEGLGRARLGGVEQRSDGGRQRRAILGLRSEVRDVLQVSVHGRQLRRQRHERSDGRAVHRGDVMRHGGGWEQR